MVDISDITDIHISTYLSWLDAGMDPCTDVGVVLDMHFCWLLSSKDWVFLVVSFFVLKKDETSFPFVGTDYKWWSSMTRVVQYTIHVCICTHCKNISMKVYYSMYIIVYWSTGNHLYNGQFGTKLSFFYSEKTW